MLGVQLLGGRKAKICLCQWMCVTVRLMLAETEAWLLWSTHCGIHSTGVTQSALCSVKTTAGPIDLNFSFFYLCIISGEQA